jgi:HAD superfamily hydrolase (TIGR01459 family)
MSINAFNSVSDIITRYDAFLIDLWGVIHDGHDPYAGAAHCLLKLQEAGKHVIFVSNAPRRAYRAASKLDEMGIDTSHYNHILTSGEVTFDYVASNIHTLGKRYLMIGPSRDDGLLDNTGCVRVYDAKDADFVVVTGFSQDNSEIEHDLPTLHACLDQKLPMLCANPDIVVVRLDGSRSLCAGVIAGHYEKLGGNVHYFGKPYKEAFDQALSFISEIPLSRIAMIGDNLDTDIKGGKLAGLDTFCIAGGILAEKLGIEHGELPNIEALSRLCSNDTLPFAVLPAFIWEANTVYGQVAE